MSEVQELVAFLRSTQTFGGSRLLCGTSEAKERVRSSGVAGSPSLILVEDVPHIHSTDQRDAIVSGKNVRG